MGFVLFFLPVCARESGMFWGQGGDFSDERADVALSQEGFMSGYKSMRTHTHTHIFTRTLGLGIIMYSTLRGKDRRWTETNTLR